MRRYLTGEGGYTKEAREKWKQAPAGFLHKTKRRLWDDKFDHKHRNQQQRGRQQKQMALDAAEEEEEILAAVARSYSAMSDSSYTCGPTKDYLQSLAQKAASVSKSQAAQAANVFPHTPPAMDGATQAQTAAAAAQQPRVEGDPEANQEQAGKKLRFWDVRSSSGFQQATTEESKSDDRGLL